jgi:hypothetical protein
MRTSRLAPWILVGCLTVMGACSPPAANAPTSKVQTDPAPKADSTDDPPTIVAPTDLLWTPPNTDLWSAPSAPSDLGISDAATPASEPDLSDPDPTPLECSCGPGLQCCEVANGYRCMHLCP